MKEIALLLGFLVEKVPVAQGAGDGVLSHEHVSFLSAWSEQHTLELYDYELALEWLVIVFLWQ